MNVDVCVCIYRKKKIGSKCHCPISKSDNITLLLGISNLSIRYTETNKCCDSSTIAKRLLRSRYHFPIVKQFSIAKIFSDANNNHFRQHMTLVLTQFKSVYCNLSSIAECLPLLFLAFQCCYYCYFLRKAVDILLSECACMCMFCHPA